MCPKILVVDDEDSITRAIQVSLELCGCEVITARRGDEAVERVLLERPDVIILDVMMPEMDGFAVLDRLKADPTTAGIPVIMLTARDSYRDVRKAQSMDADFYWTKPFKPSELSALVQKILQEKAEVP